MVLFEIEGDNIAFYFFGMKIALYKVNGKGGDEVWQKIVLWLS